MTARAVPRRCAWFGEAARRARPARRDAGRAHRDRPASGVPTRSRADGLVHLFGTGHSRIPVEEMFPRYGSYPGFNPIVELSMTFHTQVVGANGQRQAMFIERTPGLAEVILVELPFGPSDVMIVFSAGGTDRRAGRDGARCAAARPARHRGDIGRAVDVDRSGPAAGDRLLDEADLVIDLCTPTPTRSSRSMASTPRSARARRSRRWPSSIPSRSRTAQLLVERGAMPPVITRASVVGAERSRALFEQAYREHARRIARAIDRGGA